MGLSRPLHLPNYLLISTSYNPKVQATLVWAIPRSLAATDGITIVFFSSRYLDVSVPRVCLQSTYVFS